jgi:hypothetical protein
MQRPIQDLSNARLPPIFSFFISRSVGWSMQ